MIGKYISGGIFALIGFSLMGVSPLLGIMFLALAIYLFTKADKEGEEKDQERRVKMKEKELKEKELDSKIRKLMRKK